MTDNITYKWFKLMNSFYSFFVYPNIFKFCDVTFSLDFHVFIIILILPQLHNKILLLYFFGAGLLALPFNASAPKNAETNTAIDAKYVGAISAINPAASDNPNAEVIKIPIGYNNNPNKANHAIFLIASL